MKIPLEYSYRKHREKIHNKQLEINSMNNIVDKIKER